MKGLFKLLLIVFIGVVLYSCAVTSETKIVGTKDTEKQVVVENDSLEYQVIIFDIGFNYYLNSQAKPRGFYSQNYMENWNIIYVTNWNLRHRNPSRYDPNLYANLIDYDPNIDYGYDVNYKLFNYFQFVQIKYRLRLDAETTNLDRIR